MRFPQLVALATALALAAGAAAAGNWFGFEQESGFLPSPDGKWVASVRLQSRSLPVPPEGIDLGTTVSVLVRTLQGQLRVTAEAAKGTQGGMAGAGNVDMAWNADGKYLAFCAGGQLKIVELATQEVKTKGASSLSLRWYEGSILRSLDGPAGLLAEDGDFTVVEKAMARDVERRLWGPVTAGAFHPAFSEYHNPLAPRGEQCVFVGEFGIRVLGSGATNTLPAAGRSLTPSFCWWSSSGTRCLIHCLEAVKTTKPFPEDTSLRDVLLLYNVVGGEFIELSDRFRELSPARYSAPRPQAPGRVWSSDDRWVLASGAGEWRGQRDLDLDWICTPAPWQAKCLQEALGGEYRKPVVGLRASQLGIMKLAGEADQEGEVCHVRVGLSSDGSIELGTPRRIARAKVGQWFWSHAGDAILVWDGRQFLSHPVTANP